MDEYPLFKYMHDKAFQCDMALMLSFTLSYNSQCLSLKNELKHSTTWFVIWQINMYYIICDNGNDFVNAQMLGPILIAEDKRHLKKG